ncbi:hypothetical protein NEMBOFW57_008774 [Staphylotrichum longicolle]|uniref:Uncharacterized protein n=1 Tax=Staphylotrichum longicolle TaxID=669026 RepID=A0AAD4EW90_9PEZI|nr:hypothetical protein NEMBOFW57_008774 [Staphylotrichum longicolle]
MSADEALPYLQVFTPLTFTSHVSPLPPPDTTTTTTATDGPTPPPQPPLLQQHSITASSTSPRGLFAARIEMTVNTKTMAIASLAVPKLDPAAEGELRPFVARIVQQQNSETSPSRSSSSGVHNNVSVLAWGMGEWLRVAVERAKVWMVLEREVGGDKDALRGWWGGSEDEDEEDADGRDEGSVDGTAGKDHDAAALLPYMGRTSLDLEVPVLDGGEGKVSALRVQWRITFDWTGEARSDIGVLVSVPGKWHKHDERGQLSGLPKLFDELVQRGEDPLAAVRTVVCLLAGEEK